jgi:hypothetical protein
MAKITITVGPYVAEREIDNTRLQRLVDLLANAAGWPGEGDATGPQAKLNWFLDQLVQYVRRRAQEQLRRELDRAAAAANAAAIAELND